jgi:hypothetical protein
MNPRLAAAILAFSGLASAQEQKPQPPKPAPEMDQLKPLAGEWSCDGTVPAGAMGPGSPEQKMKSTMKMKKSLDGFWYMTDYEEKKTKDHPFAIKAHGPLGYDASQKKFIMLGVDNTGGWVSETSSGWEGDKLVMTGEGVMMGQKAAYRDTITKKGDGEIIWASDVKLGAAADFTSMGEQHCKRVAAK